MLNFPSRYNTNWMSTVPDQTSLAHLTVPGTHNTMAHYGGDIAECQHWLLYSQLQAGIRFLDIRCRHYRNGLPIHHGIKYQHTDFPMVLREVVRFLKDYPTEAIIMRIKKEFQSADNTRSFDETFYASTQQYMRDGWIWTRTSCVPILGDVRGKIVILQDFRGSSYGLDYNGDMFSVEDHWKVPTILDVHIGRKWQHVKSKLDVSGQDEQSSVMYITYTSGTSFWAWPKAVANRLNPRLQEYLQGKKPKKRYGIICMDFPTITLIEMILQCNFKTECNTISQPPQ
ncbi:hypothetical protein Ahia01_000851900 [Argonauta hians]